MNESLKNCIQYYSNINNNILEILFSTLTYDGRLTRSFSKHKRERHTIRFFESKVIN